MAVEAANRGDFQAAMAHLKKVLDRGTMPADTTAIQLAKQVITNLICAKRGRRYKGPGMRSLLQILRTRCGPATYGIMAQTLGMAHERKVRSWNKMKPFQLGFSAQNMQTAAEIYKHLTEQLDISTPVPVIAAQDETAIIPVVGWDPATDELVGLCSRRCNNRCDTVAACKRRRCTRRHRCKSGIVHVVGDDDKAYERMEAAIYTHQVATNATAIVVNPMRTDLPRITVYFGGTCLAETAGDAQETWEKFTALYNEHLRDVLGPLHGNASDGDSRRRAAQLSRSLGLTGERYGLPNCPSFVHTARVVNGTVVNREFRIMEPPMSSESIYIGTVVYAVL